jgi:hypothetical protein
VQRLSFGLIPTPNKGAVVKRKLGLAAAAGVLAVALAVVVTACAGSGDSDGVASLTDTGQGTTDGSQGSGEGDQDLQEAQLAFASCMREHGVDFPDPVNGQFQFRSTPADQSEYEAAQEACQDLLEDAVPILDAEQQAELRDATLAFARCMRKHGIDMPDPTFPEGSGPEMQIPNGAEDDPQFDEAREACNPILAANDKLAGEVLGEGKAE